MDAETKQLVRAIAIGVSIMVTWTFLEGLYADGAESFQRHYKLIDLLLSWDALGVIAGAVVGIRGVRALAERARVSFHDPGSGRQLDYRGPASTLEETLKQVFPSGV